MPLDADDLAAISELIDAKLATNAGGGGAPTADEIRAAGDATVAVVEAQAAAEVAVIEARADADEQVMETAAEIRADETEPIVVDENGDPVGDDIDVSDGDALGIDATPEDDNWLFKKRSFGRT